MKISEAIRKLQELQNEHGDVNLGYRQEGYLARYIWPSSIMVSTVVEYNRTIPVVIFTDEGHLHRALASIRKLAGFSDAKVKQGMN